MRRTLIAVALVVGSMFTATTAMAGVGTSPGVAETPGIGTSPGLSPRGPPGPSTLSPSRDTHGCGDHKAAGT